MFDFEVTVIAVAAAAAVVMIVVTGRWAARRTEYKLQERLRESDRLKDDFIATVSHELRTPLTSIKGYAQTLLHRQDALQRDERREFLEVIVRQCNRLGTLVETLLLASRLEAGEVGEDSVYVMAREVINEAAETADCEDRIILEVEKGLGLIADPYRLHHIVRNLIENACKYSPPEAPVLVRARQRDGHVEIEVLDQGPGIPEDAREIVFDRFQRLSGPGRGGVPGTGLGLYIARRFARDLGGRIEVFDADEGPWGGARLQLELPASVRRE